MYPPFELWTRFQWFVAQMHLAYVWMSHGTRVNKSCRTCEWVMAHVWTSHGARIHAWRRAYECVIAHMRLSCITYSKCSCHICEWVILHIWKSHVAYMNESCHVRMTHVTHKWLMSRIRMSHVTHTKESCHTYVWVSLQWFVAQMNLLLRMSSVMHTNGSFQAFEWVMSRSCMGLYPVVCGSNTASCHIQMRHVTHTNHSCHLRMRHVTHTNKSCYTHVWISHQLSVTRTHLLTHMSHVAYE